MSLRRRRHTLDGSLRRRRPKSWSDLSDNAARTQAQGGDTTNTSDNSPLASLPDSPQRPARLDDGAAAAAAATRPSWSPREPMSPLRRRQPSPSPPPPPGPAPPPPSAAAPAFRALLANEGVRTSTPLQHGPLSPPPTAPMHMPARLRAVGSPIFPRSRRFEGRASSPAIGSPALGSPVTMRRALPGNPNGLAALGYEMQHALRLSEVKCVAFSQLGSMIATGSRDSVVRLWDTKTGELLRALRGHQKPVWSCAFSPGGSQVATGSWDKTVKVWDPRDGRLLFTLEGHTGAVWQVVFSQSGKLILSGGKDETVRVWNARTGEQVDFLREAHVHPVFCVAISPTEDSIAEGSFDNTIRLWQLGEGTRVHYKLGRIREEEYERERELMSQRSGQQGLLKSKKRARQQKFKFFGAEVAADGDSTAPEEERPMGEEASIATLEGHTAALSCLCFTPDGKVLISGSHDGTVCFWDTAERVLLRRLNSSCGSAVWSCALSGDGSLLAVGTGNGLVDVWDTFDMELLVAFKAHDKYVDSCAFSKDDLATGSDDRSVKIWKLLNLEGLRQLSAYQKEQRLRQEELDRRRQQEMEELRLAKAAEEQNRHSISTVSFEASDEEEPPVQQSQYPPLQPQERQLSQGELARLRALRHLVNLRKERLEREQLAVEAIALATQGRQADIAQRSRLMLREQASANRMARSAWPQANLPSDDEHLRRLRERRRQLYRKIGRRSIGDTMTYPQIWELVPGDLERHAHMEELLSYTTSYSGTLPNPPTRIS